MNYFEIVSICESGNLAEDLGVLESNAWLGKRPEKILGHLDLDYIVTQRHNPKGRYTRIHHTAVDTPRPAQALDETSRKTRG
jgi:hypothetical protein